MLFKFTDLTGTYLTILAQLFSTYPDSFQVALIITSNYRKTGVNQA